MWSHPCSLTKRVAMGAVSMWGFGNVPFYELLFDLCMQRNYNFVAFNFESVHLIHAISYATYFIHHNYIQVTALKLLSFRFKLYQITTI